MRKKHGWKVHLQGQDGRTIDHEVHAYWDPEKEETKEVIGRTARAEAYVKYGKKVEFVPIAVERLDDAA